MKKYISFLCYLAIVTSLFFALDLFAGAIFDRFLFLDNDPKMKQVTRGGNNEQIIILGASRAAHHYIPSVIEQNTGFKCYNYGMDGRNIFNQYVVADEIFSKASMAPKLVILEVASIDIEDTPGWNYEKLSNLNVLYKKSRAAREILEELTPNEALSLKYCNFYRYNSCILNLLAARFFKTIALDENKGYVPLYSKWNDPAGFVENAESPAIHPMKEKYLRMLIQICLKSDSKLIVYYSPDYREFKNSKLWENKIQTICEEYGIPFFNHSNDTVFWEHKEWFNEPVHLNDKGAKEYSLIVAKELNSYLNSGANE